MEIYCLSLSSVGWEIFATMSSNLRKVFIKCCLLPGDGGALPEQPVLCTDRPCLEKNKKTKERNKDVTYFYFMGVLFRDTSVYCVQGCPKRPTEGVGSPWNWSNCHVGSGNQTWLLWKSSQCSCPPSWLSSSCNLIFKIFKHFNFYVCVSHVCIACGGQ